MDFQQPHERTPIAKRDLWILDDPGGSSSKIIPRITSVVPNSAEHQWSGVPMTRRGHQNEVLQKTDLPLECESPPWGQVAGFHESQLLVDLTCGWFENV